MKPLSLLAAIALTAGPGLAADLAVSGTRLLADSRPFPYTGVSFFNALYNPVFNRDSAARRQWLAKFRQYGVNVLRVWCQWDNARSRSLMNNAGWTGDLAGNAG